MVIISLFGELGSNVFEIGKTYAKKKNLQFISFEGLSSTIESIKSLDYKLIEEEILILEQLEHSKNDLVINSRFAALVLKNSIKIKIQTNEIQRLSNLVGDDVVGSSQIYGNLKMVEFYTSLMAFGYFNNSNYSYNSNFNYCINTSKRTNGEIQFLIETYVKKNLKLI